MFYNLDSLLGLDKMDEELLNNSNIPLNLDLESNNSLSEIFNDPLCQDMFLSVMSFDEIPRKKNVSINLGKHYSLKVMKNRLDKRSFEKLKNYYELAYIKEMEEYLRLMIINGIGSPLVQNYRFKCNMKDVLNESPSFYISNNDKQYLILSFIDSFFRVLIHYLCEFYDMLCESDLISNNNSLNGKSNMKSGNNNKLLYIRPKFVYKYHGLPKFSDCL